MTSASQQYTVNLRAGEPIVMATEALTRKQLPAFGVVEGITIDVSALADFCREKGYLDPDQYVDGQRGGDTALGDYWSAYNKCNDVLDVIVNECLSGNQYRQLALSRFNGEQRSQNAIAATSARDRLKRIDRNGPDYVPEADEHNFGMLTEKVEGPIKEALDKFKSPFARVRFATLAPRSSVDPHIDYDPSYVTRYHIPIVTNKDCWMCVDKDRIVRKVNFAADGRVYFLNTGFKHWIENNSDQWRVHLIVDTQTQADLKNLTPI